jgi:hypothetical protein
MISLKSMAFLAASAITFTLSARASELPAPNKLIALVQSEGCDTAQLRPRMETAGRQLADDAKSTRVIIDWPLRPEHNVDQLGRASPIVAVLEVAADQSALTGFANVVRRTLGSACRSDIYLVYERRLLTSPRTWKLGEPSPQPKTFSTLVRKEGLSREEFNQTWGGPHAEIALSWRTANHESGGHYIQNLVLSHIGDYAPPLDGIGEGGGPGTASPEELKARMKAAVHSQTFVDMSQMKIFIAQETVLKD